MMYEFGSVGWLAFTHGAIAQMIEAHHEIIDGTSWSMCEVFTDPPAHLSPNGAPIAWHYYVRGGRLEFGLGDRPDVDYHVSVDYDAVLPVARLDTQGDPARATELGELVQSILARGLMTVTGDAGRRDPRVRDSHDVIARVTR
jgi:hypothetical protein